jgi:DNA-directed RNA polymerase specialized sigma24 family protein
MSYLEGMSNREIADEMGLPVNMVKRYKMRGLDMLKHKLPDNLLVALLAFVLLK